MSPTHIGNGCNDVLKQQCCCLFTYNFIKSEVHFLGAFEQSQKAPMTFVMSVHPSAHMSMAPTRPF
jgi:hypothetical protein